MATKKSRAKAKLAKPVSSKKTRASSAKKANKSKAKKSPVRSGKNGKRVPSKRELRPDRKPSKGGRAPKKSIGPRTDSRKPTKRPKPTKQSKARSKAAKQGWANKRTREKLSSQATSPNQPIGEILFGPKNQYDDRIERIAELGKQSFNSLVRDKSIYLEGKRAIDYLTGYVRIDPPEGTSQIAKHYSRLRFVLEDDVKGAIWERFQEQFDGDIDHPDFYDYADGLADEFGCDIREVYTLIMSP